MQEIRCGQCSRKLGVGVYVHLVIKCPRCGTINSLRATRPSSARHRASNAEDAHAREETPQNPSPQRPAQD
ncbi:Com family DNA-binding transcriptional regulator [Cupriavidus nantongensis]|uniref:Com family DNA-binding transcriptional regulator n=1 Tax=Cupriavidus nantongensis TaxID=1796606 RepID=UPI0009EDE349|nr:Com family DNA-binding transcriptional regulator [Cupriavidus nantongensis]